MKFNRLILTLIITLLPSVPVSAATVSWNNVGDGLWSESAKWSPVKVPDSGDDVFINNSGSGTITVSTDAAITTLTVGGAKKISLSTGKLTIGTDDPCDTTPDAFTLTDQTGVGLSQPITSNTITVSGITCASPISITGGTYSINGAAYTSASGTVSIGNGVTVQQSSSSSYSTITNAILTIGGVSDTFSVTTMDIPPPSWGTAILIETNNSGNAGDGGSPQVAFDASGNAIAVWSQSDGTRLNINSNRYTASTGLWGAPTLIETDNAGSAYRPQVAINADSNAIAVWHQDDGSRHNINSNRYTASTGLWGTATLIETDNTGGADYPEVAIDAAGNAVAVWQSSCNIWSNRYNASTGLWGTAMLIETGLGCAGIPHVAIDVNGNAVAVWNQDYEGRGYNIYSNRYTASTGLWGAAVLIETQDVGSAANARVAIDAAGNALAVWYQYDGFRNNIYSNRYTASTGLWGTAALIETDNAGGAYEPQIAINSDGNAVAVWRQSDGIRLNIWSNHYTASTGLWGTATLIDTEDLGDAEFPQVAIDTSGNAFAVWHQHNGSRNNIWSNRYTASTGLWGTATMIETNDEGGAQYPDVAIDASGNAVAVWYQWDGARYNIWSNMYR